jgi:hypothetical protein
VISFCLTQGILSNFYHYYDVDLLFSDKYLPCLYCSLNRHYYYFWEHLEHLERLERLEQLWKFYYFCYLKHDYLDYLYFVLENKSSVMFDIAVEVFVDRYYY